MVDLIIDGRLTNGRPTNGGESDDEETVHRKTEELMHILS